MADLSLYGIGDVELLAIVDDLAGEDGATSTIDVRLQLGENIENGQRSGVGPRLAWMVRYGWLERAGPGLWRLSDDGVEILDDPELSTAFDKELGSLNAAQRLEVVRAIAGRSERLSVSNALRRQWKRSIAGRR